MKQLVTITAAAIALCCLTSPAGAIPWTWADTVDPTPDIYVGAAYTYTHDIRDSGFDPGSDLVNNFDLAIDLYDDKDKAKERVAVILDRWLWSGTYDASKDIDLKYGLLGSFFLLEDGVLQVTLKATTGDFYFASSTLTANGNETTPAPVPEPATLLLLGVGLISLGAIRRKNTRR